MFAPILQYIDQSISDLAWRPEGSRMKALGPKASAPPEDSVHAFGDPNGKALEPARESAAIQRLDEQVHVIALDGEVQYAKVAA